MKVDPVLWAVISSWTVSAPTSSPISSRPEPVGHHLHGTALRSDVDFLEEISVPVRHREIRGDRSDVDAEEDLGPALRLRRRLDAVAEEDDILRREGRPRGKRALLRLLHGQALRDPRPLVPR